MPKDKPQGNVHCLTCPEAKTIKCHPLYFWLLRVSALFCFGRKEVKKKRRNVWLGVIRTACRVRF